MRKRVQTLPMQPVAAKGMTARNKQTNLPVSSLEQAFQKFRFVSCKSRDVLLTANLQAKRFSKNYRTVCNLHFK